MASCGLRLDEAGVWGVSGVCGVAGAVAPGAVAAAVVERRDNAGAEERAVVRAVVVRDGNASVVLVVAVGAGEGKGSSASLLALCTPSPLTVRARRLRLRGGTLLDREPRLRRPGRKLAPRASASQLGFFGGMLEGLKGFRGTRAGEALCECEVGSSDSSALNNTLAGVAPCGPQNNSPRRQHPSSMAHGRTDCFAGSHRSNRSTTRNGQRPRVPACIASARGPALHVGFGDAPRSRRVRAAVLWTALVACPSGRPLWWPWCASGRR
jgi:hypothetical protein